MMKPITDIWRQLVRRRLWPVALLLVGAAAAVPVMLAKEPEVAPPAPPAAANGGGGVLATEPIVALSEPADPDADRRPLGKRHDIFKPTKKAPKPQKAPKVKVVETKTSTDKPEQDKDTGGSGTGGGTVTPPAPTTEPEKQKTYPPHSLLVRFGENRKTLPIRSALPSAEAPLLVYLGLTDRNKTAVFLLDASLKAQGDGECDPTPENCETLHLRAGETEFFDVVDAEGVPAGAGFQLDLLKINPGAGDGKSARSSAKSARVSRVSSLQAGFHGEALRRLGVLGRTR